MTVARRGVRIGVTTQLYCVTILSTISVATLAGASVHFAKLTESVARRLQTGAFSGVEGSARLQLLLEDHRRTVESAHAELDPSRLASRRRSLDAVSNEIANLTRHGAADTHHGLPGDLAGNVADQLPGLTELGHGVIGLAESFARDQDIERAQGRYATLASRLQDQVSSHRRERRAAAEEAIGVLLASARALLEWVTFSTLAAIVLIGPIAFLMTYGVLSRLKRIAQVMAKLAKDDTSANVPSWEDQDEVGDLARAAEVLKAKALALVDRQGRIEAVNQQFGAALGNMPLGLCLYDADGRLVVSNQRFWDSYGFPPETIGPSLADDGSGSAEGNEEQNASMARRARGGFVQTLSDGRTILVSNVPLETGGWLATYEDITDRRLAEEELRAAKTKAEMADRAKTQLLDTMSHEIRAPLDGILGYADLLLAEPNLSDEHRRYLQHIQTAGATLLTVVNDALDFSKIEAAPIELESQSFSPLALIDSAVSIVQTSADRKGLALHREVESAPPTADPPGHDVRAPRIGSILVVDDAEINREVARAVLETAGHRVDAVDDGTAAIAAIQANAYDLVLMDVQMPGMDGLDATRIIRGLDHGCSRIPIIAMTADVLPQQVLNFKKAGMDHHIGKPFRRDQLLAVIDSFLASAEASRAAAPAAATIFDHTTYSGLLDMMGREGMNRLLDRLMAQLHLGPDGEDLSPAERNRLASDVHGLVSAAGMLGFCALCDMCRELEQACRAGADLSRSLARFREARDRAIDQIAALRAAA